MRVSCNQLFFVKFVDINNSFISIFLKINNIQLPLGTLPMFLTKVEISKLFSMTLYFTIINIEIFLWCLKYKINSANENYLTTIDVSYIR